MSTCISSHGEYSNHIPDPDHYCTQCGQLDEENLRAELVELRTALDREHAIVKRHETERHSTRNRLSAAIVEAAKTYYRNPTGELHDNLLAAVQNLWHYETTEQEPG